MFFNKTLLAKLKSESGQALATADDTKSAAKETSGQSQAQKLEGLLADIDLSDVPAEHLDAVKKHLTDKVKLYDAGFRAKTEDFSRERKEFEVQKKQISELTSLRDEIQGNPKLEAEITKVINQARSGTLGQSQTQVNKDMKKIDQLIASAPDSETRETLRQLKEVVEESSNNSDLQKKITDLEEKYALLANATRSGQAERVETAIRDLQEEYGKEFVDKYSSDIRQTALKLNSSVKDIRKLLKHFADDDELEAVILDKAKRKKEQEDKRKTEGSSGSGNDGVVTPLAPRIDKHGRTDVKDLVKQILAKKR